MAVYVGGPLGPPRHYARWVVSFRWFNRESGPERVRRRWQPWAAAVVVLVVGLVTTGLMADYTADEEATKARVAAEFHAGQHAEHVAAELAPMDSFAHAVRSFIVTDPRGTDLQALTAFMKSLYPHAGGIVSAAVAPGNRVATIIPEAGNEAVLGLYYPDNAEQWPAVRDAMRTGLPVLTGPIHLVQGGLGLVLRIPVFRPGAEYWGVVSTVTDVDALLQREGDPDNVVAVRQSDDPAGLILGDPTVFAGDAAIAHVSSLDTAWDVAVPVPVSDGLAATTIRVAGVVGTLALAMLVYLLVGALRRERALVQLMSEVSAQAPGMLFQMRQGRDGTRRLTYASAGIGPLLDPVPHADHYEMAELERLVHPEDRAPLREALEASARTSRPWHQRFRLVLPGGVTRWLLADARPRTAPGGEVVWHGWMGDITRDVQDEESLRVSASLFAATRDGVAVLDVDGIVTEVNAGFRAMTGYARDTVVGAPFFDFCEGLTPESILDDLRTQLGSHGYWRGEITSRQADGTARTDRAVASAVRDGHGRLSHYLIVLDNMNLARDDPVTGLPNRRLLDERVHRSREDADRTGTRMALVVIGLDQFHHVNDAYGHRIGDQLLSAVAQRLSDILPATTSLTRLRGDEFAFLLPSLTDIAGAEEAMRSCLGALAEPFNLSGRRVRITASAGITVYPDDAGDVAEMYIHANLALRAAKSLGAGQHCYVTDAMQAAAIEREQLLQDLQAAWGGEQIQMLFQPVVDLRSGEIHRAEALMRWAHPARGPIPPDVFIPLAEQSSLICDLGDIAFTRTIAALGILRGVDPDFQIGVNLSPAELREPESRHQRRIDSVTESGLPGSAIIVEITEGILLSHDPTVDANLEVYRAAGMRFAIDDFGTGYSSLASLQQLDVHFLKIDRSFVEPLAPDNASHALCQAIIVMANKMSIAVIAEGVENQLQHDLLTEAGCDYAQGFLYARPLSQDAIRDLLDHRRSDSGAP